MESGGRRNPNDGTRNGSPSWIRPCEKRPVPEFSPENWFHKLFRTKKALSWGLFQLIIGVSDFPGTSLGGTFVPSSWNLSSLEGFPLVENAPKRGAPNP